MRIPTYQGTLWLARVSGEATVSLTVGPDGAAASVDVQNVQTTAVTQLVSWLKSQMSTVKLLLTCPRFSCQS
jgi:hypothetical protein